VTLSEAFGGGSAAEPRRRNPVGVVEEARPHARMRTRGTSVLRVTAGFKVMWFDLRDCWWTPASWPTLQRAWAERMPDRDAVPGDNTALYRGWVAYNHTVGLLVPLVGLLVVGLVTPALWMARHPARLLLAAAVAAPFVAALVALT
jgi:hypothetical protein